MDVGIIGAGRLGQAMARVAIRAGHTVVISNSRGPESLASVVAALGDRASAGTVDDAAAANLVVIAVPWEQIPEAVGGRRWDGRQIVIDASNDFDPGDLGGRTSSEVVSDLVRDARVVKAGNTLAAAVLGSDPHEAGGQRVIFLSGDDREVSDNRAVPERRLLRHRPRRPRHRGRDAPNPPSACWRQPDPAPRERHKHDYDVTVG
jgi:predicted dinucleotide-binding enzyme